MSGEQPQMKCQHCGGQVKLMYYQEDSNAMYSFNKCQQCNDEFYEFEYQLDMETEEYLGEDWDQQ